MIKEKKTEEEKKKFNISSTFIIILGILVVTLGGYIVYDKLIINNNIKDENINTRYKEYAIGDEINLDNEKWRVISNSDSTKDYVVAIKYTIVEELLNKPYYVCPKEDDNGINCNNKMNNDYQKSNFKNYFDETYIKLLGSENLKEIDGYKIRLITLDELISLGCKKDTNNIYECNDAPKWLPNTWTMTPGGNIEGFVWYFGPMDTTTDLTIPSTVPKYISLSGVGSTLTVSPVINLLKSSIE